MNLDDFLKSIIESTTEENVGFNRNLVYDTALKNWGEKAALYAIKKYNRKLAAKFPVVDLKDSEGISFEPQLQYRKLTKDGYNELADWAKEKR